MYGWDAGGDYHKHSTEQHKWGIELLNKLSLRGNERILDLGCGDGKITAEIARRVPWGSVLGIDKFEDMIRLAKDHFFQDIFPNLVFEPCDARDIDFNCEFDIVFCNAMLHWIPEHLPVLEKITKSLKNGGKVIAQMGGKGNASRILKILAEIISDEKWAGYFRHFSAPYTFYDAPEYGVLLESASLTVVRIVLIAKEMVHDGPEGLAAWIRTTWLPYTRRVPPELHFQFIHEIVDTYLQIEGSDRNGIIPVEMVRLEFEAIRKQ